MVAVGAGIRGVMMAIGGGFEDDEGGGGGGGPGGAAGGPNMFGCNDKTDVISSWS